MSLQDKALKANGLSRACGKCKIGQRRCTPEIAVVCKNAFVEGYKKGYKQSKNEHNEKISSILHDASENVGSKRVYIFFRDVRGDENYAEILGTRFVKGRDIHIGEVRFKPPRKDDPQQLPIAWINEQDLLNLLGYNKRFKELERISLSEGWAAYPKKEYYENLNKYGKLKVGGK